MNPEAEARVEIDEALELAGWSVQDRAATNLYASRGVAIREFPLAQGHGFADYLLYVDRKAVGVVEAKKVGETLTGVELQTAKYSEGMPENLPKAHEPLPFLYESTGVETRFTSLLDPEPRSRGVFHFHTPEELAAWLDARHLSLPDIDGEPHPLTGQPSSLRARLQYLPPLHAPSLWSAQRKAVENLETSLQENRPRALIQMATGSGKTYTAITAAYRLIKHADAKRVLFLVDRTNLGKQALKEFQQYTTPDDGRKFTELYNVQHLTSNRLDPVAKVVITTIQRLYSMLKGDEELPEDLEERSLFQLAGLVKEPVPVAYQPEIPIGFFDFVFIDECHRSIYTLWRQVVEYFDAFLTGLTATPSKQTFGFFRKNLVMEYSHPEAVADRVNVDFEVYRIRTRITEQGSKVDAGYWVDKRDRTTRTVRWEKLEDDLEYDASALDRKVVAPDQIRTVIRTFRDRLPTEIFPGRTDVPKTLIYAKDDSHAEDIVRIVREEFGRGNEFAKKITYKTSEGKPEDLIAAFRTSYNPRVVVTVDMIATGTDIKPLEVVMFLRAVKSRNFFEQMKGRGVRVIQEADFQAVTPDAKTKDHFVLVDCVGVTDVQLADTQPLERKRTVSFDRLLEQIAWGNRDPDAVSSLASRLSRLDRRLSGPQRQKLEELTDGQGLSDLVRGLIEALDSDRQAEAVREREGLAAEDIPTEAQLATVEEDMIEQAVKPIAESGELRDALSRVKQQVEQTIDTVSIDEVRDAGFSDAARQRAEQLVHSWEQFVQDHLDEITALQVLYSRPYQARLRFEDIRALADRIEAPPRNWTPERLWQAYEMLEKDRVRGASGERVLTDIVSLVRHALDPDDELVPFREQVEDRYRSWLVQQEQAGRELSAEQREWLELIKDHVASSLQVEMEDLDYAPFVQKGGAGKAYQVFGEELGEILDELNEVLAA